MDSQIHPNPPLSRRELKDIPPLIKGGEEGFVKYQ